MRRDAAKPGWFVTMLKALVKDLNEVDEGLRQYYVEKEGVHYLNVTPIDGYVLDNVDKLKSTVGALRKEKDDLETKFKAYADLDPAKAREAIKKVAEFTAIDPAKEADRIAEERLKARDEQLKTLHANELKTLSEKIAKRDSQVQKLLVANAIKSGLAKLNPLEEAADALEMIAERAVRLKETAAGDFVVEIVDETGAPRIKDSAGNLMGVDDLLTELRDKRPSLFKADAKQGIDTRPGGAAPQKSSGKNPWVPGESFNITEQFKLEKLNPTAAARLRQEAGVSG
jgi:hypothetical protein